MFSTIKSIKLANVQLFITASLLACLFQFTPASAAYDGGRVIDNTTFLKTDTMNEADIQSFLASKNSGLTSRTFNLNCSYEQQTEQWYKAINAPCGKDVRPSAIIYYAAQVYGINPQVILATLQKEQSLVTNPYPDDIDIKYAMGYGCPTSGTCTTAGFFEQVDMGTWTLRFNYERANKNFNWWKPSTGWVCDGRDQKYYRPSLYPNQNVTFVDQDGVAYRTHFIENAATSSMYCYTPHTYNNPQGLYGRDPYGNVGRYYSGSYNFVHFFEIWFGSTIGKPYSASEIVRPANYEHPLGFVKTITFKYRNSSAGIWYDDTYRPDGRGAVHLAVTAPINKNSPFAFQWPSPNRPAKQFSKVFESDGVTLAADQHKAIQGQIVEFTFKVVVPESYTLGIFRLDVQPIVEGTSSWDMGGIASVDIKTIPSYKSTVTECPANPLILKQNEYGTLQMRFHNNGLSDWYDTYYRGGTESGAVQLATANPLDRHSPFTFQWPAPNRPAKQFSKVFESDGVTLASDQHKVIPGQIAEYSITFYANDLKTSPGTYKEEMKIVQNSMSVWDMLGSCTPTIIIEPATYKAQYLYQSVNPTLAKGETGSVFVAYQNKGTGIWYDETYRPNGIAATYLASDLPINHSSPFSTNTWPAPNRPAKQFSKVFESDGVTLASDQHKVIPGQIAYYSFPVINNSVATGQRQSDGVAIILEGTYAWRMSPQYVWYDIIGK